MHAIMFLFPFLSNCTVCQKRRLLVLSTGLWHPGVEVSDTVPLEREIQSRLEMFKVS
jgi:hypothetical protein